jgi:hypothetical protein
VRKIWTLKKMREGWLPLSETRRRLAADGLWEGWSFSIVCKYIMMLGDDITIPRYHLSGSDETDG